MVPPTVIRPIQQAALVTNTPTADRQRAAAGEHSHHNQPPQQPRAPLYTYRPSDQITADGRQMQATSAASQRMGIHACTPASDGQPRYVINCCHLVWPVSKKTEAPSIKEEPSIMGPTAAAPKTKIESWTFPVEIISYRNPSFHVYEGL